MATPPPTHYPPHAADSMLQNGTKGKNPLINPHSLSGSVQQSDATVLSYKDEFVYNDRAKRTVNVKLPVGRDLGIYGRGDFADAFEAIGLDTEDVEAIGPVGSNSNWQLTIKEGRTDTLTRLVQDDLVVRGCLGVT